MKTILRKYSAFLLMSACLMIAAGVSSGEPAAADAEAITFTIEEFHKAMAAGKPDKVMSLLLPDALIVEAGTVQTRQDYQQKHLSEDMAFARAVPVTSQNVVVRQEGTAAWVTTMFRMVGQFHDKPIDNRAAETVILTRTPAGWRIRTIHWSSYKAGSE